MPELPDIVAYLDALEPRVVGKTLFRFNVVSPFVVRTFEPTLEELQNRPVRRLRRIGKRFAFEFDDELFLLFHLMIAGRFRWSEKPAKPPGRIGLAAFEFETGTLLLVEASQKKRASLHVIRGERGLVVHDPGGLELLTDAEVAAVTIETASRIGTVAPADLLDDFAAALRGENHTIKRSLTDPRLVSGIGNAYSDEILHAAQMSPTVLTQKMPNAQIASLLSAARCTLLHWIAVLREHFKGRFPGPGEITAFRDGFAVHGRFNQPCPVCQAPVQRIRFADNETNYCPRCQTGDKILADRSLSRLLKDDWPRTLDDLE